MRTRVRTLTAVIGLGAVAAAFASAPTLAAQSKVVLAQIVNTTREPVPIVDIGGPEQTTLAFYQEVHNTSVSVDVAAFGRIRVVVQPESISDCTVQLFVQPPAGTMVQLGELSITAATGAMALYDLPGQTLRLRTFRTIGDCSTRVAIYGRE